MIIQKREENSGFEQELKLERELEREELKSEFERELQRSCSKVAQAEIEACRRPKRVSVCGRIYEISFHDDQEEIEKANEYSHGLVGSSNHHTLQIKIFSGLSLHMQQETLLHEIMHCVFSATQAALTNFLIGRAASEILAFDFEEFHVEALDAPLLAALKENPEVTAWLLSPMSEVVTSS